MKQTEQFFFGRQESDFKENKNLFEISFKEER